MTEILTGRETNLRMFGTFTPSSGRATASSRSAVRIGPRTFFGLESRAASGGTIADGINSDDERSFCQYPLLPVGRTFLVDLRPY